MNNTGDIESNAANFTIEPLDDILQTVKAVETFGIPKISPSQTDLQHCLRVDELQFPCHDGILATPTYGSEQYLCNLLCSVCGQQYEPRTQDKFNDNSMEIDDQGDFATDEDSYMNPSQNDLQHCLPVDKLQFPCHDGILSTATYGSEQYLCNLLCSVCGQQYEPRTQDKFKDNSMEIDDQGDFATDKNSYMNDSDSAHSDYSMSTEESSEDSFELSVCSDSEHSVEEEKVDICCSDQSQGSSSFEEKSKAKESNKAGGIKLFKRGHIKKGCKQLYDKYHYCTFCKKKIACKIAKHILIVHSDQPRVSSIKLLPKQSM